MIIKLNATRLSVWWRRAKSCFTLLGHFRSHMPTSVPLEFVDLTWDESWCVEARTRSSSSDFEGKLVQLTTCAQRWASSKKSNQVRSRLHLNTADHREYFPLDLWFTLTINYSLDSPRCCFVWILDWVRSVVSSIDHLHQHDWRFP